KVMQTVAGKGAFIGWGDGANANVSYEGTVKLFVSPSRLITIPRLNVEMIILEFDLGWKNLTGEKSLKIMIGDTTVLSLFFGWPDSAGIWIGDGPHPG